MADNKRIADFPCALSAISRYSTKPQLLEPDETHFWDDHHISKSMLKALLNPDNDVAMQYNGGAVLAPLISASHRSSVIL
jgi:hypothetical protein